MTEPVQASGSLPQSELPPPSQSGSLEGRKVAVIFQGADFHPIMGRGTTNRTLTDLREAIATHGFSAIDADSIKNLGLLKTKVLTHIKSKMSFDDSSLKGKIIRVFYNIFVAHIAKFRVEREFQKIEALIDANSKLKSDHTPLTDAVYWGYTESISELKKAGANLNAPDAHGFTPLTLAVFLGNQDMITELKKAGADLDTPDARGFTPSELADFLGKPEILKDRSPSTPVAPKPFFRWQASDELESPPFSPLTYSVYDNNFHNIDFWISQEYDINQADGTGWTPLTLAVFLGNKDMIIKLAQVGANLDLPDANGRTPSDLAAALGNTEIIAALQEAKKALNAPDAQGFTRLTDAISHGNEVKIMRLIKAGADVNALDGRGETPLTSAIFQLDILKILIRSGANVNAPNKRGDTPLAVAKKYPWWQGAGKATIDLLTRLSSPSAPT